MPILRERETDLIIFVSHYKELGHNVSPELSINLDKGYDDILSETS